MKRVYMRANLVVHPDKVKQKGGTVEQLVIADLVFDVLKTAWGRFEATALRREIDAVVAGGALQRWSPRAV